MNSCYSVNGVQDPQSVKARWLSCMLPVTISDIIELYTGAPRGGGVAMATAPGPVRGPRLQSEVKATDNTRLIDD